MVKNPLADAGDAIRSLDREDPLEEDTASHSNILAWRIPWTEEPGGLQTMGLQESDTTEQLNNNQLPCDSPMIFLQINIPLKPGKGVQYSGSLLWGTDNCIGKLVF